MNQSEQPKDNNIYSVDADGIKKTHETIDEAIVNVRTMYAGFPTDQHDDPDFLLGSVYANGKKEPILEWFLKNQVAQDELEAKVGKGIKNVISPENIMAGIFSHSIAFFRDVKSGKWIMCNDIASAYDSVDVEVDLNHIDLKQYSSDWTITDYIEQSMGAFEEVNQIV